MLDSDLCKIYIKKSFLFWSLFFFFVVSPGEYVAQFKFTVLLMANGPLRITNGLFEPEFYKSEHEVQDPELKVSRGETKDLDFVPSSFWGRGLK